MVVSTSTLKILHLTPITLLASGATAFAAVVPTQLQCESRLEPLGVDVAQPRMSWVLDAGQPTRRGARQSSYQVLVASSAELLAKNVGDLWNSGQVKSEQNLQVLYKGKPLASARQLFWKVRLWDNLGQVTAWSSPSRWTMGLLQSQDWKAQWIGAPNAQSARKTIGYHAAETEQEDDTKWVQVDLGQPQPLQTVRLHPMLHVNKAGFGFPLRFKVEASNAADFKNPTLIADQTAADFPSPGTTAVSFDARGVSARFVRVTATKLWKRDATVYAFALSQLEVRSNGKNVALNAPVTAKDSVENYGWGAVGLTDGTINTRPDGSPLKRYPTVLLRKELRVKSGLKRALVFVCGLGQYEISINGTKAGDDVLAPGWTNYKKTCLYDTRDITAQLKAGNNALGLFLGNGMYNVGGDRYDKFQGSFGPPKAIAQIRLEYKDGSMQTIGTDASWRVDAGPITFSDIYGGEDYDARLLQRGWDQPGFKATSWAPVIVTSGPGGDLKGLSYAAPPIRTFESFKPVSTKVLNDHTTVYDMGQNAAIMPRLVVSGPAGAMVRIWPAELLKGDGSIEQGPSGSPAYWQYTLAGGGQEIYFPKFYYRGARYLQVETSAPDGAALPVVQSLQTVVVQADSPSIGTFTCSNPLFQKVFPLVRWAQRSNMVSVMTDCPHREKLGWLEEDHLNGPALRYNFDLGALSHKIMNDMADSQVENGFVPNIAPEYVKFGGDGDGNPFRNSPEWGSSFMLVAWQQYEFSGDDSLLRQHYAAMKRYLDYLGSKAQDHIVSFGLSDWYDIGPGGPGFSKLTPMGLTATAFYFQDAVIVAQTAKIMGLSEEATRYQRLAEDIKTAFNGKFFNATTYQYGSGSQAANSIALVMDIVPTEHRAEVLQNIVTDVQQKGLTAGDVGYRYLLRALADGGRSDVIYTMNNQSEKPGYGMQLAKGATSLTEAWDADRGSSQNHFMLGQINEWFYHDLAGIQSDPQGPGFKKIIIKPAIVGDLTSARATYNSGYGPIISSWARANGRLTLDVSIPPNTTATIYLPTSEEKAVTEAGKPIGKTSGIQFLRSENGAAVYAVISGNYAFSAPDKLR